jgi:hypothetical protein
LLGEAELSQQIQEIQMLEKDHLQIRVIINDKIVKLALLDYELRRQKFLHKTIDDVGIEI